MDGATAFAGLDQQGLLQKGFEPSAPWNTLGRQSLPADKSNTPIGITLMAALVYDKATITSPPPTWQQLLSSAYKGEAGDERPVPVRADLAWTRAAATGSARARGGRPAGLSRPPASAGQALNGPAASAAGRPGSPLCLTLGQTMRDA